MANTELLKKVKKVLTLKPELWDQHQWARTMDRPEDAPKHVEADDLEEETKEVTCGTAMCVAGWTCFLSGERIDWKGAEETDSGALQATFLLDGQEIETRARELLDIDPFDAGTLFYGFDRDMTLIRIDELIETGELAENSYLRGSDSEF